MDERWFVPLAQQRAIEDRRLDKVVVVGAGQVGVACAYAMLIQNTADELVLLDLNHEKLVGEAMDLEHGIPFVEPTVVRAGTLADCAGADVVVLTAGAKQRPGESRLDLVRRNAELFRTMIPPLVAVAPEAIFLVVSNPVDVLTHLTLKLTGFPPARVLGSGTVLDTARFRYLLARRLGVDPRSLHAYVLGEHGDSEVPAWSAVQVGGTRLGALNPRCGAPDDPDGFGELFEQVRNAASEIIRRKGATCHAIGLGVSQIVQAIVRNQNRVLTVSTLVDPSYGLGDVCLSLPTVVGRGGAIGTVRLDLDPAEARLLARSAAVLRGVIAQIDAVDGEDLPRIIGG